MTSRIDRTCP